MLKILYISLLLLLVTSCWKSDLEELGIKPEIQEVEKQNINKENNDNLDNTISDNSNIEKNTIVEETLVNVENNKVIEVVNKTIVNEDYFINNDYLLNNLWAIKEYYKVSWNKYNTAYIEGNNILYFSIEETVDGNYLSVKYPESIDVNTNLWNVYQPIFRKNADWKVIIIDLNTIKVINNTNWLNKVIWKK